MKYIIIILIIICIIYWYWQGKRVRINEKKNKEYEYFVISPDDIILKGDSDKYICSQIRRRDLLDITEMDVVR